MEVPEKLNSAVPTGWVRLTDLASVLGVHPSTVFRWAGQGVRGTRLQITRIGGRTGVTPSDVRGFLAALNNPGPASPPAGRSEASSQPGSAAGWPA